MKNLWMKSVSCFNLIQFPVYTSAKLDDFLQKQLFSPCGAIEREKSGFIAPFGHDSLVWVVGEFMWLQVKSEKKILPTSVVVKELDERIKGIEAEQGRRVGRKESREMKEQLTDELLAKAMVSESYTNILIDTTQNLLLIGTSSVGAGEAILKLLLKCVTGLDFQRIEIDGLISKKMAELLIDSDASLFTTDSSLVLKGKGSPAPTVKFAKHSLASSEVEAHLKAGLSPIALELGWTERMSFVLTDPFAIKSINYLELSTSDLGESSAESEAEIIDATLLLQAAELRAMLKDLFVWIKPELATPV